MKYDPEIHHRHSIRLKGYDYSQSVGYFITVCTQDRACFFGDAIGSEILLNEAGRMVASAWHVQPDRFPAVRLDAFVVMPNHIHGIVWIENGVGAGLVPAQMGAATLHGATILRGTIPHGTAPNRATTRVAPTNGDHIGDIVGAFKSLTTVAYARGVQQSGWLAFRGRLWQRNYYEHIIRDDESLNRIRQYILDNPSQWDIDPLHVDNPKRDEMR